MGVQARELRWGVVGMDDERGRAPPAAKEDQAFPWVPPTATTSLRQGALGTWLHPVRSSSFSCLRLFSNYNGAFFPVTPRDPFYLSCWTTPNFLFFSRHGASTADHNPIAWLRNHDLSPTREAPTIAPSQSARVTPTTNPFKFLPVTATGCLTWPSSPMTAESIGRSISLTTAYENPNRLEQAAAERQSSRCKNT